MARQDIQSIRGRSDNLSAHEYKDLFFKQGDYQNDSVKILSQIPVANLFTKPDIKEWYLQAHAKVFI